MTDYKDRVSGWATDIDWSKAPENAKGAIVTKTCNVHHPKIVFASGYHLTGCMIRATAAEDGSPMSAPTDCWDWVDRPAPQWNGEGLPPVGTVCELRTKTGGWGTAEIKYMSSTVCVWLWIRSDGGEQSVEWAEPPYRMEFRQIKTPAQIAAEEREAAAKAMRAIVTRTHPAECPYLTLYDAGYRKIKGDDR